MSDWTMASRTELLNAIGDYEHRATAAEAKADALEGTVEDLTEDLRRSDELVGKLTAENGKLRRGR